jgi:hypothetical protein
VDFIKFSGFNSAQQYCAIAVHIAPFIGMKELEKKVSQKWIYNSRINKSNQKRGPVSERGGGEIKSKKRAEISPALAHLDLCLGQD